MSDTKHFSSEFFELLHSFSNVTTLVLFDMCLLLFPTIIGERGLEKGTWPFPYSTEPWMPRVRVRNCILDYPMGRSYCCSILTCYCLDDVVFESGVQLILCTKFMRGQYVHARFTFSPRQAILIKLIEFWGHVSY